jgi:broad specificity phosphatase PhoE
MRLLLVRHGETVDNVAAVYAGVRDSALTTHGVLQAARLGSHLASTGVKISHIFSSDLQRAFKTAEAVRLAQVTAPAETVRLQLLREQDFGYYEGKSYLERSKDKSGRDAQRKAHADDANFQDVESKESMRARMKAFISSYLIDHFNERDEGETVVVVAHGIILAYLWRSILTQFTDISVETEIPSGKELEYLGAWSNTGYLDLEIKVKQSSSNGTLSSEKQESEASGIPVDANFAPTMQPLAIASPDRPLDLPAIQETKPLAMTTPPNPILPPNDLTVKQPTIVVPPTSTLLPNLSLTVKAVNKREHMQGLKKTRGGIGSLKHDDKQQTVDSFFKKQRIE